MTDFDGPDFDGLHLKDDLPPKIVAWVHAELERSRQILDQLSIKSTLDDRFAAMSSCLDRVTVNGVAGDWVVGSRYVDAHKDLIAWAAPLNGSMADATTLWEPSLHPRPKSGENWNKLIRVFLSPKGTYCVIGLSLPDGSAPDLLVICRIPDGARVQSTELSRVARGVVWHPDSSGFFYNRYKFQDEKRGPTFGFWTLSENDADHGEPSDEEVLPGSHYSLTGESSILLRRVQNGGATTVSFTTLGHPLTGEFTELNLPDESGLVARATDDMVYILSDLGPPRSQLEIAPIADLLQRSVLVPETDDVLTGFRLTATGLLLHYLSQGTSRMILTDHAGRTLADLELPPHCRLMSLTLNPPGTVAFLQVSSLSLPDRIYRLDIPTATLTVWHEATYPDYSPGDYTLTQAWAISADGTQIPLLIFAPDGHIPGQPTPLILNSGGGTGRTERLLFDERLIPWVQAGGIYVVALVRGSYILGEDWHNAALGRDRAQVNEDLIACAEYLIDNGYTRPTQLGLLGRGPVALLINSVVVQRPELFRAAVCVEAITDLLSLPKDTGASKVIRRLIGDPDSPDDMDFMRALSPYQNVRDGAAYPAMLFINDEDDDTDIPLQTWKMVSRLRSATSSGHPILMVTRPTAPRFSSLRSRIGMISATDKFSFLAWQLGLTLGIG